VVALPIGDDLQRPHQGIHEVLQVLPPLKSFSKNDFEKSLQIPIFRLYIFASFTKFDQNCFYSLGVKEFF
jgi:hypothetical protein